MTTVIVYGDIERAIRKLRKWFDMNLKKELRYRVGFETFRRFLRNVCPGSLLLPSLFHNQRFQGKDKMRTFGGRKRKDKMARQRKKKWERRYTAK